MEKKRPPKGSKLLVGRAVLVEAEELPLTETGTFELEGLPSETYEVHAIVPGYHLSMLNKSVQTFGDFGRQLTGRIDGDLLNLRIRLEPGEPERLDDATINLLTPVFKRLPMSPLVGIPPDVAKP